MHERQTKAGLLCFFRGLQHYISRLRFDLCVHGLYIRIPVHHTLCSCLCRDCNIVGPDWLSMLECQQSEKWTSKTKGLLYLIENTWLPWMTPTSSVWSLSTHLFFSSLSVSVCVPSVSSHMFVKCTACFGTWTDPAVLAHTLFFSYSLSFTQATWVSRTASWLQGCGT